MPSSKASSQPRNQTCVSYVSCVGRQVLHHWHHLGSPFVHCHCQLLSCVWLLLIPWTAACQSSLSLTVSRSLLKFMSIESVMLSNHLILCHLLLLLPSIFSSIRVFSSELALCIRWPKYWSFSLNVSLSSIYSGRFPLGLTNLISWQSKGVSGVFSSTTIWRHQFFAA